MIFGYFIPKTSRQFKLKTKTMRGVLFGFLSVLFFMLPASTFLYSQVLIKIEDKEITAREIERLYKKNLAVAGEISLEDYIELYIDFQLKVYDAEKKLLNQNPSFQEEFKMYRQQLTRPYLTDPASEEVFLQEAYERMQYDVHASHILVRIEPGAQAADTLLAWEKANRLREQILAGEEFESVARRASDDPSAKINSGEIGYFTVFQMVYPFEKAAYELQTGEISLPVRSRFGYHIIRVNEKRKAAGEVRLQHILLRLPAGYTEQQADEVKTKATEIYQRIKRGEDFGKLAVMYSQDMYSVSNNGEMSWFGTGRMIPDFEKVAFSLTQKGEISEPFRTQYGWHIVKLLDKKGIDSYENIKDELREKLYSAGDERSYVILKNFLETLKKSYGFREEPGSLEYFLSLPETWFTSESEPGFINRDYSKPLFYILNKPVKSDEFALFMRRNSRHMHDTDIRNFVLSQYRDFSTVKLLEEEDKNLEDKYPELRYLVKEYHDGLLLFEITEKEVWARALADSAGLQKFYSLNRKNYLSPERMDASVFYFRNKKDLDEAHQLAARNARRKYSEQSLVNILNRNIGQNNWSLERKVFSREEFPISENISWKKGLSNVVQSRDKNLFFFVHGIIKPEPMPMEQIRGLVISDYQEQLEKEWVQNLRKNFRVILDKDVMTDLKNKFNN